MDFPKNALTRLTIRLNRATVIKKAGAPAEPLLFPAPYGPFPPGLCPADERKESCPMLPEVAPVTCTPRIQRLKEERQADHIRSLIPHRDQVYREEFAKHPDEPACMRFARGFSRFLGEKHLYLKPYDLLAGYADRYSYNTTLPALMPEDYDPTLRPEYDIDNVREANECKAYHSLKDGEPDAVKLDLFAQGIRQRLYKHWESGHILPGYERVLSKGFAALADEARTALNTVDDARRPNVQAMLWCCEGATAYIDRYAALCASMAETCEEQYRPHLRLLAESCTQIARGPARTFLEAVQLIWFVQEMLYVENDPSSISLGRLDRTLFPYYEKDVAEGRLTYEQASEIMDALWIKFSANLHSYQNVTIGGMDPDTGAYTANAVTYLVLQSTRRLQFDQPLISLRYGEGMPDQLWAEALALVKTGTGFPAFFNDTMCIPAKEKMGIAPRDAKNYALIGCVEMGTPGKEYAKTEVLRINWPMVLELMLNGGRTILSGGAYPLAEEKDLAAIGSFEEFYDWFKTEMIHFGTLGMDAINLLDPTVAEYYPTPFLSCTMEGCMKKGLDVTGGGTIYNNTGVSLCGMANAVDALAAIRQVVFENHLVTLPELAEALRADFAGYEELQSILLNRCPKYGNDDDSVDGFMADLVDTFARVVETYRNPRGGKFQLGLYSVEDHAKLGVGTGASADGRKAATSLANAISPVQGRDTVGPTAVINSVLKTDLSAATNGMVLDLKFNPAFLESPRHTEALRALIDAYCRSGGMEIQFNVVDRATLMEAQQHPEKHKDLVVRVSGFSAYFVTLMKTTQDEIINRTEYASM